MRAVTSHTVSVNRRSYAHPTPVRPRKRRTSQAETAAAAVDLVTELLSHETVSEEVARRGLRRFETRARAVRTAVWSVTNTLATRQLSTDNAQQLEAHTLTEHASVLRRLYRHGAVICHSGEVCGLEDLVPKGVRSFVVAASPKAGNAFAILVIGWSSVYAPCAESAVPNLRIAAALLHRALTNRPVQQLGFSDAILGSLVDRIVVLDRNGQVIATDAAWTGATSGEASDSRTSSGPGPSYDDVLRRASTSGAAEAASIFEAVLAVARGNSDFHQTAYPCDIRGEQQWCVISATPFQHPGGGAVVAHTLLTPEKVTASARRTGQREFQRLVDAIPVPVWILSPDGHLRYANERWTALVNGNNGRPAESREWTDAFHPGDRERARAAFHAAVLARAPFELELRLKVSHGVYQVSACIGAPSIGLDGSLEGYVGFCRDLSAQRRVESALRETALKVITAQEVERSRIGRELHDDLGQRAAVLAAKLEAVARSRRASNALRAGLAEARDSVQELAIAIHNLSHQLHPAKLRLLGLVNTLKGLCREVSKERTLHIDFNAYGVTDVPEEAALCVFRVAQEALQNAVKHSDARDVSLDLAGTASRLTLRVTDHGRGFDPLASEAIGIGLLTMRERVELSGGQLTIRAEEGRGTTIEAILPLREHSGDDA